MIGLGGGSLAKYCRRHLPDYDFTAVEISPEVISLRNEFGIPEDGPLFRIIQADGAAYIHSMSESFDVLLVDGFDPEGQPDQLCSLSFYDDCRNALKPGGTLVVNLCADDLAYSTYASRIRTVFNENTIAVEADEGENIILFACKDGKCPPDFKKLTARLRTLEPIHHVNLDRTAQKILYPEQMARRKRKVRR